MKKMKRSLALLVVVAMLAFIFTACGDRNAAGGAVIQNGEGGTEDNVVFQIGIIQIIEHPALDDARAGFMSSLANQGFDVEFDFHNAQGDASVMSTIAQRFNNNNVDLILAIGTPVAQAVAAETDVIPIVGTAITNYVVAGLVESNERPGFNVTGASDFKPVEAQIAMIPEFVPDIQVLGLLYSSNEANSVYQAAIAREAAEAMGWEVRVGTVTTTVDIHQVATSVANQVDAIYIPTDNTFASAMSVVAQISQDTGTPVFAAEANMVMGGGVATLSFSYYDLGYESGLMAGMILRGEAVPAELPIRWSTNFFYVVNGYMADALGMDIPERFLGYVR